MRPFVCIQTVFLCIITVVNGLSGEPRFLEEFFRDKNVHVIINACWSRHEYKLLNCISKKLPLAFHKSYEENMEFFKTWHNNNYFILDLNNCSKSLQLLQALNKIDIFVYPIKFLLLTNKENFNVLLEIFNELELLPNSEVIVAVFEDESALLSQPYKVGKLNELVWENYGNWSLKGGLFEYYIEIPTTQRRSNLHQVSLNVAIVVYQNDTWNHLTDYKDPGIDTFTKQDFESMKCTFEHLNINYTLKGVNSYGYYNAVSGEFDGLIREVQSGSAAVSGGSMFFTEDRYRAVDLLKMGNPLAIRFIVKKPSTSYIKNIFFITFTVKVWSALLGTMVISAVIINIILNWEAKAKEGVKQDRYTISDVTLIALEAVCQQGTATEPKSFSGRIIAVILFGAFMFIYVSYSANIVVLLQSSTKINNIKELLDSRIEAGASNLHFMRSYLESVKKGVLKELYERKIYPDKYFPTDEGMRKLQEGNFAFHVLLQAAYEYILKNFTNYEICGLQELPGYIEENRGYVAITKHSPYKDIFKVAILKVDEYGLQRRTNLRVIMKPKCFSQSATFKTVGIYDCYQVFFVWILGTILALFIFCTEILTKVTTAKFKFNNNLKSFW